ncbi:MAG TPA: hypothetical protein VF701_17615 [Thermoanaerobaculia bacterium]
MTRATCGRKTEVQMKRKGLMFAAVLVWQFVVMFAIAASSLS